MPRDRLLASSVFALAAAVALHALSPARAQETAPPAPAPAPAPAPTYVPPAPAPPSPPPGYTLVPTPRPTPECRNVRVGTAKEVASIVGDLQAKGLTQFFPFGSGLVCGWQ
jgi:hypothetical protein